MEDLIEKIDEVPRDTKMSTEGTIFANKILSTFLKAPLNACRVRSENTNFLPMQLYTHLHSVARRKGYKGQVRVHIKNNIIYLEKEHVEGLR